MTLVTIAYLVNLIIFGLLFLFTKNNKHLIANNFLLACFTILGLLFFLWDYFVTWYSGYLLERLAFYERAMEDLFISSILLVIATFMLPLLNFKKKFRKSIIFQTLIVVLFLIPLFLGTSFGLGTVGNLSSMTPGWHTTVEYSIYYPYSIFITFLFLLLNIALVRFKCFRFFTE